MGSYMHTTYLLSRSLWHLMESPLIPQFPVPFARAWSYSSSLVSWDCKYLSSLLNPVMVSLIKKLESIWLRHLPIKSMKTRFSCCTGLDLQIPTSKKIWIDMLEVSTSLRSKARTLLPLLRPLVKSTTQLLWKGSGLGTLKRMESFSTSFNVPILMILSCCVKTLLPMILIWTIPHSRSQLIYAVKLQIIQTMSAIVMQHQNSTRFMLRVSTWLRGTSRLQVTMISPLIINTSIQLILKKGSTSQVMLHMLVIFT